jgi:hypothetical protein
MAKRIIQTLKSKSGASMMFVLGVMLTLLFISTSVLVAASAAVGAVINRQVNNQLGLYADSIHRTVYHSLLDIDGDEGRDVRNLNNAGDIDPYPASLGGQLVAIMYHEFRVENVPGDGPYVRSIRTFAGEDPVTREIDLQLGTRDFFNDDVDARFDARITDGWMEIDIEPTVQVISRDPLSVMVSGRVTVRVLIQSGNRRNASETIYNYTGGYLEGTSDKLIITDVGRWELVSYEKT